eukprot:2339675-Prymnesium_polylepis.1
MVEEEEVAIVVGRLEVASRRPEPRRYIRYSVSGYSSESAVVYKYTRYSKTGLSGTCTADAADAAAINIGGRGGYCPPLIRHPL